MVVGPIQEGAAANPVAWTILLEAVSSIVSTDQGNLLQQVTYVSLYLQTATGQAVDVTDLLGEQRAWNAAKEMMLDDGVNDLLDDTEVCVRLIGPQGETSLAAMHPGLLDMLDKEPLANLALDPPPPEAREEAMRFLQKQHRLGGLARVLEARKKAATPCPALTVLTTAGGRSLAGLDAGELGAAMAPDRRIYLSCSDCRTQAGLILLAPMLDDQKTVMGLEKLSTPAQCPAGAATPSCDKEARALALAILSEGAQDKKEQLQRAIVLCRGGRTPKKRIREEVAPQDDEPDLDLEGMLAELVGTVEAAPTAADGGGDGDGWQQPKRRKTAPCLFG